jgi:RNA-directed DNA polymerase
MRPQPFSMAPGEAEHAALVLIRAMMVAAILATIVGALADWETRHVLDGLIVATPADLRAIQSTVASYQGHLRHANSALLWRGLVKRFWWLPAAVRPRRFAYQLEGQPITISAAWT